MSGSSHQLEMRDRNAAIPSTLAVIDSKSRWRNRTRTESAAIVKAPNTAPAATPPTKTVGVPRPRRLMVPMSQPM